MISCRRVVRLGWLCSPRSGQKWFEEESPLPTRRWTKPLRWPLSSFTIQGRLTLATPPQLACSLWRGLSGGAHTHTSTPFCSPNEMPVSENACGTVKVKKKGGKEKENPPGVFVHHLMGGRGDYWSAYRWAGQGRQLILHNTHYLPDAFI